jgi:hypothetical protein
MSVVVLSDFFGAKTTNINTREIIIASSIKIINDIKMILTQVFCHHLCGLIFFGSLLLNSRL